MMPSGPLVGIVVLYNDGTGNKWPAIVTATKTRPGTNTRPLTGDLNIHLTYFSGRVDQEAVQRVFNVPMDPTGKKPHTWTWDLPFQK